MDYHRRLKELEAKKPPQFPMMFKDYLRRLIGGRRYADRLAIYRKYRRFQIRYSAARNFGFPRNITEDQIEDVIGNEIAEFVRVGVPKDKYKTDQLGVWRWRSDIIQDQRKLASRRRWPIDKAENKQK